MQISESIQRVFERAIRWDRAAVEETVAKMVRKHPTLSKGEIARKLMKGARMWGAGAGALTGLPGNVVLAAPAALIDAGSMLALEMRLAAEIATLYEPGFLDKPTATVELLIPVFGSEALPRALVDFLGGEAKNLTRKDIREHLSLELMVDARTLFMELFAKRWGISATARKAIPLAGALLGAVWNWKAMDEVGTRIIGYFNNESFTLDWQALGKRSP